MLLSKIVFLCIPSFPNPCLFRKYISFLKRQGFGSIEIYFPFIGSILDGSTIRSSCTTSLSNGSAYGQFIICLDFIIRKNFVKVFTILPVFTFEDLDFLSFLYYRDSYITGYIVPDIDPYYPYTPTFIKSKIYHFYHYSNLPVIGGIRNAYISLSNNTGSILNNKHYCLSYIKSYIENSSIIVGFGVRRISHITYFYKHVDYIIIGSKVISFLGRNIYIALRFIKYVKTKIKENW
ncbi:hypothetical protein [Candidatus Vidania fulgoroideorum]